MEAPPANQPDHRCRRVSPIRAATPSSGRPSSRRGWGRSRPAVRRRRAATRPPRWKTAARKAGCPGWIPHDFRRTAVRNLLRATVPERVAMQMTGHKTRSVFERYNIVSSGDLREAASKLDQAAGIVSGIVRRITAPGEDRIDDSTEEK